MNDFGPPVHEKLLFVAGYHNLGEEVGMGLAALHRHLVHRPAILQQGLKVTNVADLGFTLFVGG